NGRRLRSRALFRAAGFFRDLPDDGVVLVHHARDERNDRIGIGLRRHERFLDLDHPTLDRDVGLARALLDQVFDAVPLFIEGLEGLAGLRELHGLQPWRDLPEVRTYDAQP